MVRQASIIDSDRQRCVIVTCCNDIEWSVMGVRYIADLTVKP